MWTVLMPFPWVWRDLVKPKEQFRIPAFLIIDTYSNLGPTKYNSQFWRVFPQHIPISLFFFQCWIRRSMFRIKFYVQILVPSYLLNVKPHSYFFNVIVQIWLDEEREMSISVFYYGFWFWLFAPCGRRLCIRRLGLTCYLQLEGRSNPTKYGDRDLFRDLGSALLSFSSVYRTSHTLTAKCDSFLK
jgi:hypothetical protein